MNRGWNFLGTYHGLVIPTIIDPPELPFQYSLPFDYSVFSAAAAAFLLAFWEPDRFTLDKLLNRLRN